MSVSFVGYNTPAGTIPVIFGAQATAGDQVYCLLFTNSTGSGSFSMSCDSGTMSNVPCSGSANFTDGHGDLYSLWNTPSISAPANVASSSQNTSTGVWTTGTNTYSVNQPVTITGTPPGGFATGTTYYVLSSGLSSTSVELSATQGGAVIVPTSSSACTLHTTQQNFTVSQPAGDSLITTWELEFSGGLSTKSPLYTTTANPGGGTGAVVGQPVTVASGDLLVVLAYNADAFGNPPTVNNAGWPSNPTKINDSNSSTAYYFAGTGGSVTPSFNAATGDVNTPHNVVQFIVSATSLGVVEDEGDWIVFVQGY